MKERSRESFPKRQSRISESPAADEGKLAELYGEFAEEDCELADEGMADYSAALAREDAHTSDDG